MKSTRLLGSFLIAFAAWFALPAHALSPEYYQLLSQTQGFLKVLGPSITRPPVCTPAMVAEGQGAVERGIREAAFKVVVIEPLESAAKLALTAAGFPAALMTTYTMSRCAMEAADAKSFAVCAVGEALNHGGGEVLRQLGVKNREEAIANYAWDKAYSSMVGAISAYQAAPEVFEYSESHGCLNEVKAQWNKRRQPGSPGGSVILTVKSSKCPCQRANQVDHGSMRMVIPVRLVPTGANQPGWTAGEPREVPITVACCSAPNAETAVGVIPGGGVTYPRDPSTPIGPVTAPPKAPPRTATTGGLGGSGSRTPDNAIAIPGAAPRRPGQPGGAPLTIGGAGAGTPATGGQRWSVDNPCPACKPVADALKASLAEEARLAPLLKKANEDLRATILERDALKPKIAALQSELDAMAGTGGESIDRDTGIRTESYVQPDGSVRIRTYDRTGKLLSEATRPYETAQKARADLAAANARMNALNAQEPGQVREAARLDDALRTAERESQRLRGELAKCVEEKCKGDVAPGTAIRTGAGDDGLWHDPSRGRYPPTTGTRVTPVPSTPATGDWYREYTNVSDHMPIKADPPKVLLPGGSGSPGTTAVPNAPVAVSGRPCDCKEILDLIESMKAQAKAAHKRSYDAGTEAIHARGSAQDQAQELRRLNPSITQAQIDEYPGIKEAREAEKAAKEIESEAELDARGIDQSMFSVEGMYRDCVKRCTPPPEPKVIIGINTGGNNPFNPRDPMGGRTTTGGPPVQPGSPGAIQFVNAAYTGIEGNLLSVIVERVGGKTGAVSVSYATGGGSATPGSDYAAQTGTLTWADNANDAKLITFLITDDTLDEPAETFNITLSSPTGGATLGSLSTATVTIAASDNAIPPTNPGTLQFTLSAYETIESAGAVTITVTRTGGTTGAVGVSYATNPSTAAAGQDFTSVSGTLQWANGDAGAKTFSVPIIDDTIVESPETFFVALNAPTGGATLGAPSTSSVAIQDNDVNTGPCGAQGNAWQPNTGNPYSCSGSCSPNATSPVVSVSGDIVTVTNFHAGGAATFQGCSASINSQSSTLVYFGQANHRATITRTSNNAFSASIVSSGGGSCAFSCSR